MGCLCIGLLASCSASTANIKSAQLARGYANGQAVDPTTTFDATDTFHVVVDLANAPDDTKLKVVWTAVESGDTKNEKILKKELVTGSSMADFTLTHEQPFPAGTYKAELFLNDAPAKTLDFTVK